MKLKWQAGTGMAAYVADGESYSYQINLDLTIPLHNPLEPRRWQILKMRQPGGQIVNSTFAMTIEGAMARGQTWENADGQTG